MKVIIMLEKNDSGLDVAIVAAKLRTLKSIPLIYLAAVGDNTWEVASAEALDGIVVPSYRNDTTKKKGL